MAVEQRLILYILVLHRYYLKLIEEQKKKGIHYPIQNEIGVGSQGNKSPNTKDGEATIKEVCWKLETDRLGNIAKIIKKTNA